MSAGGRAVAAPDLAVDGGGAHGLFGPVVGRVDTGVLQEGEQLVAMLGQVLGQSLVVCVGPGPVQHPAESAFQSPHGNGQTVRGQLALVSAVPQVQGVAQQAPDGVRRMPKRVWKKSAILPWLRPACLLR